MDSENERMRVQLFKLIEDWNANRLDLFALSQPTEDLEFHGVMRFFFQEAGQKVATKCIRVSSTGTTRAVIDALVEKFHPDLRMLSTPKYTLWEVHENGEERQLRMDEKPLLVQLNWHKDDREGRFLLRRDGDEHRALPMKNIEEPASDKQMKRKLSKREKREQKKKDKRAVREAEDVGTTRTNIYAEVPPTTFTRTISNPEIVMKKRRERKLAEKLKNIGEGGSLKIYGEELSAGTKPYVTLLVSIKDRTDRILRDALEKYGIDYQRYGDEYYLAEIRSPLVEGDDFECDENGEVHRPGQPQAERILDDDDCPLLIYAHDANKFNITFHVRRKTPAVARETEKRRKSKASISDALFQDQQQVHTPCLIELNADGSEAARKFYIHPNVTEIGNDRTLAPPYGLPLHGPYVHARHCVLAFMDGVVTLTPCSSNCDLKIDEQSISETTVLRHGQTVRIGVTHLYRFVDLSNESPQDMQRHAVKEQEPMVSILRRTPSEQGMIRSSSTSASMRTTPAPVVNGQQTQQTGPPDGQFQPQQQPHYKKAPAAEVFHQQPPPYQQQSAAALAQHRRTPPIFSQPSAASPQRPTSLFGRDAIPAIIELLDNAEEDLLSAVVRDAQPDRVHFKLAPAYVIYMCCRYRVSPHYRTGIRPEERGRRLAEFLSKLASRMHVTIQDHCHDVTALAFWMANCSELLNFLKLDGELNSFTTPEPQESMADAVQKAYDHLAAYFKQELHAAMSPMLDLNLDDHSSTSPCIHMLSGAMSVMRHCRVNPALTIQIFSQLFHYVNMYLFNWLVSREGSSYCVRQWGLSLSRRLTDVQSWSEKQGLELAADCRLERILQASQLLQTLKTPDNFAALCATTTKLNSLQLRSLLERYRAEINEPPVDRDLIENLVKVAENQVDDVIRGEGQPVQLEEELELQLPFLLPDDGYSPEIVRGLPNGLREFVENLLQRSICRMILQPSSSGSWMVHMTSVNGPYANNTVQNGNGGFQSPTLPAGRSASVSSGSNVVLPTTPTHQKQPEIVNISFPKGDTGIGLSIVQAQAIGQTQAGIYVKKVVPGSAAARDGRLQAGDQLLKVNGQNLVGISQEAAAKFMAMAGPTVHFEVGKSAALHNGLATWIYQQSPDVGHRPMPQPQQAQSPAAAAATGRVRSVEHIPQYVVQQQRLNNGSGGIYQQKAHPNYTNLPAQQPQQQPQQQQPQIHHQRYPSSSSLQHQPYYQQPQQQQPGKSNGPPPVQYPIYNQQLQQQTRPLQSQYGNHGRSMSASNLKEDAPPMPEAIRYLNQQQQPGGGAYWNNFEQQQQPQPQRSAHTPLQDEHYYQNLAQYQQQQQQHKPNQYSINQQTTNERMSVSDYGTASVSAQQQPSPPTNAYANKEYHRLPTAAAVRQQPTAASAYPVHRAPNNEHSPPNASIGSNNAFAYAPSAAASVSNFARPSAYAANVNPVVFRQNSNNSLPPNVMANNGKMSHFEDNSNSNTDQQMQWRRPSTPSAYDVAPSTSPQARMQQQQQKITNAFPAPNLAKRHSEGAIMHGANAQQLRGVMSSVCNYQEPLRHQETSPSNEHVSAFPAQASLQQKIGQQAAAMAASGYGIRRSIDREDRERQIDSEVERLMLETVTALEAKEFLTDDERKRYRALKYELEYRRRLHSATSTEGIAGEDQISGVENDYEQTLRSLEPAAAVLQQFEMGQKTVQNNNNGTNGFGHSSAVSGPTVDDMARKEQRFDYDQQTRYDMAAANDGDRRDRLERRLGDIIDDTSAKRQLVRDYYFEEAEQQYIAAAAKERDQKDAERLEQDAERQRKWLKDQEEERKRDFARMHITELQSKLHNVNVVEEKPKPKTNGYSLEEQPAVMDPQSTKRKVVFNDAPPAIMHSRASSEPFSQPSMEPPLPVSPPPPLHEAQFQHVHQYEQAPPQPPKKYVYETNFDGQQPRAQVIGGQEVYRDPRQERLKNLQQRNNKLQGETEKLSFKDKMRLFAAEIGEATPKDRMKASSAQREIEGGLNGSTHTMTG